MRRVREKRIALQSVVRRSTKLNPTNVRDLGKGAGDAFSHLSSDSQLEYLLAKVSANGVVKAR